MIISASRRTDIPAFFSDWFVNRVREGFCCVRNPFNANQVSRVSLSPSVVDCVVFWTKNPGPMLGKLDVLGDIPCYFLYTLTSYGRDVEPGLPEKKQELVPTFLRLSEILGSERVIWRYDPILFTAKYSPEYHLHAFAEIARMLEGATEKCIISFVNTYRHNERALGDMGAGTTDGIGDGFSLEFVSRLQAIAAEHGMKLAACAQKTDFSQVGVSRSACIDRLLVERLVGSPIKVGKDKSQRPECLCAESVDIGCYDTCGHGCRYCYANHSDSALRRNLAKYDSDSPLLCDCLREDDMITERPMHSLVADSFDAGQLSFGTLL